MEILISYITVGTLLGLYWMATVVVCAEMVAIGKDVASFRNK
jgi:hypothetical protein